jgi:excisionase family DNA binding protein
MVTIPAPNRSTHPTSRPAPPAAPPRRRLAGITVIAEWLNCDQRTVRRMIKTGALSGFRIGRHLKVDLVEIEVLMTPVPPESVSA